MFPFTSDRNPAHEFQVEKKEKPEDQEADQVRDEQPEPDAVGADASDAASERDLSRREQKAPAREQPTTGEDPSSPSGAGEGQDGGRDEVPRLGAVVVTALLTGGAATTGTAPLATAVP